MKRLIPSLLLIILASNACQGAPLPTETPTSTPVLPTPTHIPAALTIVIAEKNLIEWADLRAGKGPVYSQDWSPTSDPLMLASASQDGSVRLWDADDRAQIAALETGWAFCVAWSPAGKQVAVGAYNGEIQVWDATSQALLHTLKSGTNSRSHLIRSQTAKWKY